MDGSLRVDVEERPDEEPPHPNARARARIPRRCRGDPRPARRRRPDRGLRPLDPRARCTRRHRGYAPGRLTKRRSSCSRRSTSSLGSRLRCESSGSGSPSFRFGAGFAMTSRRARRSSSASTSSGDRWSRFGRSSATTTHRSPTSTAPRSPRPHAGGGSRAGGARSLAWSEWVTERRVVDDPHVPGLADRRSLGQALRGASGPR